ncbi:uncharacterized protein ACNS7B_011100 [Menidia menidia]
MGSGCLLPAAFLVWALTLSEAQAVNGPALTCLRSSPAGTRTRVTFLREDREGARSLFLTMWSKEMQLVACLVYNDSRATEGYRALCETSKRHHEEVIQSFNISMALAPNAPCAPVPSRAPEFTGRTTGGGSKPKSRAKRSWIFPGTLWCGSGSKAMGYEELGMFEGADRCCREHDHCPHIIPAFTMNYGVFNRNFFTVSHCDCDQRFRQCLLGMNDSISHMVGYSFFNILQVSCFELKQLKRCTEMYWFGMCKVAKEAPYAVFKSPLPYNNSDGSSNYSDSDRNDLRSSQRQNITKIAIVNPRKKSSKKEIRCLRDPPRGDTFYRKKTKWRECQRHQEISRATTTTEAPNSSRSYTTTLSMKMGYSKSRIRLSNRRTAGKKKSIRKVLSGLKQRGLVPISQASKSDLELTSPTSSSIPSVTQGPWPTQDPARALPKVTKTSKRQRKTPKQSQRCVSSMPSRGDSFQPHRKSCVKPDAAFHTTVKSAKTTSGLPTKQISQHLKKTTERPNWVTSAVFQEAVAFSTTVRTTSLPEEGKPHKINQQHFNPAIDEGLPAEKTPKQNEALQNITDNQLQCQSLKILDDCKFKIPPLQTKYNLLNMESKTVYHCDCTSRLAIQIASFQQLIIPSSLLVEFVSQQCFTLPKKKKCHHKKRCFSSFSKAFDLYQALQKMGEKGTADIRITAIDRKRRIPVRLYKRCLRLEKGSDIMAQLK